MSSTLAYSTSIARLYKSTIITKGTVNELLTLTDWKDALNLLKDRGILSEVPSSVEDAERKLRERAVNFLTKIRGYVRNNKINSDIVDLYIYLFSLKELEPLVTSILSGNRISDNFLLIKDIVDYNPQTLDDLTNTSKGLIKEGLKFAVSKANKKTPSEINSLLEYFFIYRLSKMVSEFKGDWKSKAQDIICGYKDYYSVMLAFKLHLIESAGCKIDEGLLKDISSATKEKEVLDALSRSAYAKSISTNNVYDALADLYHVARINARKSSIEAFMGSPFTPATILAISELIKLDYEDLTAIINGLKLGITDKVKKIVSFELL